MRSSLDRVRDDEEDDEDVGEVLFLSLTVTRRSDESESPLSSLCIHKLVSGLAGDESLSATSSFWPFIGLRLFLPVLEVRREVTEVASFDEEEEEVERDLAEDEADAADDEEEDVVWVEVGEPAKNDSSESSSSSPCRSLLVLVC